MSRPYLVTLAALAALACGPAVEEREAAPPAATAATQAAPEDTPDAEALRALESLGYLGSETERTDEAETGVVLHDPARSQPGLNFYVSGHASEAWLVDMEGRPLHSWAREFPLSFPDAPPDPEADRRGRHHWRRAYPQPNGDLIAIHEGQGLVRLDRDSRPIWLQTIRAHHAAQLASNGELWVLSRKLHTTGYRGAQRALAEDFVSVLDANTGELLRETSVVRAMLRSPFRAIAEASPKLEGDVFHTNSLELLDGRFADRQPAFAAGSLLLSSRVLHTVFVLDPAFDREGKAQVTWALQGSWRSQHEPHLLDQGEILLFDNSGAEPHSRVIQVPLGPPGQAAAERVVYAGSEEQRFYSKFCGAVARLANGNTLITETGPGRAFEITPEGERVWEFVNPASDGGRIASIFELVRLPADFATGWLDE